ncbi:uncharacterized protein [Diabrotica undecimpunctata]|uniref:uncharacterized protein n=1 Tax=Diabrotica undecimpunctata TaxID=50387 RepID=UPI003B641835
MEEANHWTTIVKCNLCDEIPRTVPLYQCPLNHQYCIDCFVDLKRRYKGYQKNGATCVVCKVTGAFTQSKVNADFLNKIKTKPGIGRPYRYNANQIFNNGFNCNRLDLKDQKVQNGLNVTVEALFRLPTDEVRLLLSKKNGIVDRVVSKPSHVFEISQNTLIKTNSQRTLPQQSKVPIKCPHKPCKKVVATSTFVTHFKHEHPNIPKYNVERGKEICLPCDVSSIEHNSNYCIAVITVYEFNKIDIRNSQSSQSVIKTCSKFSQHIPINSFWLMVTGSPEKKPSQASALFWLFCPCEDHYRSTIELCSKSDSIAFSTYCEVHVTAHNLMYKDIAGELNCLMVSKASLGALLREGPELNLRITVH